MADNEQELLRDEERQKVWVSDTWTDTTPYEDALCKAQIAKLKRILRERGVDAKYLDAGH